MVWYDATLHRMAEWLSVQDISLAAYPLVLLGGLLTNFCPCNLVLLPMVIGCVGGFSRSKQRGRTVLFSAVFAAGIVLTLCVMGAMASVVGAILAPARTVCLWLLAIVTVAMGLFCLRAVRFRLPGLDKDEMPVTSLRNKGLWGAFLMGLAAGVVATPCTTPVLAVILAYVAVKARLVYGMSLLFIYALGFVVPLLLTGAFTGFVMGLKKLEDRTGYRAWITRCSGILLIVFGLYVLKVAIWG
ncbi:MAG: cytochrome c biogenesis CcdA family protein [Phycisphaerales bacterium]